MYLLQRRDARCLRMTDATNTTSHHLTHTTTPVTVTTEQQRTSSITSAPLSKTSTVTNPSTHSSSSTSKRTIATPQPSTSKPAEGKKAFHITCSECKLFYWLWWQYLFSKSLPFTESSRLSAHLQWIFRTYYSSGVITISWINACSLSTVSTPTKRVKWSAISQPSVSS